jgi:hypothetical protein
VAAEVPLATRRASRTRVDGAMKVFDVANDARTGANIRGSSMAALVLERRASQCIATFRDARWSVRSPHAARLPTPRQSSCFSVYLNVFQSSLSNNTN